MTLNLSQFDYSLPKHLIAQKPVSPRDRSRLLVLNRNTGSINHKSFFEIRNALGKNDVLVMNNTKVFPARVMAKDIRGRDTEFLLTKKLRGRTWEALRRGKVRVNDVFNFAGVNFKVSENKGETVVIEFPISSESLFQKLYLKGVTPLPPYIQPSKKEHEIRKLYQTVYAKKTGSIAAPTAGFHFTGRLIKNLTQKGVQIEYVTLHVGLGTFLPIKTADITKHHIHSESFEVDPETAKRLNKAKSLGKRLVAVGTTTTRVLETLADQNSQFYIHNGQTDLFIYPPYKFKFVDALITNFHLPRSTLLALVSTFVSTPNTTHEFQEFTDSVMGKAYAEAIQKNYRFYSFGDAMFIY